MNKKNAKSLTGIFIFVTSLITYLLTLEPTNSFWDCSEFITCAYNLEVGHAPGAPVFMLLGRLFGLLANKAENVALMINALSAVGSALTVLFLFLTIYWFAEKLIANSKANNSNKKQFITLVAAFIGAMAYAFSDSFWFSAVEAEVYATSSFFTALVFWAILQYSSTLDTIKSVKWVILIFFILGLSVGIHLLNMLTIPVMGLVIYFKHYKYSTKGIIFSLVSSSVVMLAFIFGVIPGVVKIAAFADRILVNNLGLPEYSGVLFFIVLLLTALVYSYKFYAKKQKLIHQVIILSLGFWLIGYSSFAILVIRSSQNPFVDINNVQNIYGLVDYLNREQYPTRPLIYGNNYNSPITEVKKRFTYKFYNGKYIRDELNPKYEFDSRTLSFFPRMASMDELHIKAYKQWVDINGRPVKVQNRNGEMETIYVPTFNENIQFFLKYQVGYMYWRYFMWNFVGKQNDIQGRGDIMHGNWLSGIPFFDDARLGKQENLPDYYKNLPSHNTYFFLPFLLGLIGFVFQFRRDVSNFWVNLILFFFTGLAIVLYLNEVPITPRERDYVHVGSFYVFAIWIGLGVVAILNLIAHLKKGNVIYFAILILLMLAVPLNMLKENWDDHNRSNRYVANACGKNMLKSCEKNAILFTTADNDTYPIWYLQEVENYRPDVRNILLTFLPVGWYADQLINNYPKKGSIAISFKGEELLMSENQYLPVVSRIDSFMDVGEVIDFVKNPSAKTKVHTMENSLLNFIPGTKLELKVDKEKFKNTCAYLNNSEIEIPESIKFTIKKNYLGRDDLLILDILAHNNWERPLYFVYPNLLDNLGLGEYLHREGMVYRLMPFTQQQIVAINKERSQYDYQLIMNDFEWGNYNNPKVFLDHTTVQMAQSFRLRQMFVETANLLMSAGEHEKAIEVLDKAQIIFPPQRIPYSWFMPEMVKAYQYAGNYDKAMELSDKIENEMMQRYQFFQNVDKGENSYISHETIYVMQQLANIKLQRPFSD